MRIFFLGAHKLLVKTELERLRKLGYEVFNPPYNTPVPDQSAHRNWNASQPTTLPKEIFDKLSKYNFFYNPIDECIADLLNQYFDAVVVTIHPWWLSEVLRVYKGKVIYRTYGQNELLSEELVRYEGITDILNRDNFYFMPFHSETIVDEDDWLKKRAIVVPYCIDPSIMDRKGTWQRGLKKNGQLMVTCPNINNPFYLDHYNFLKKNFSDEYYKFFGVQLAEISDPQIMGTISYEDLQNFFTNASGFLYTYTNSRVCYLPPIEMTIVGGPVLYPKGCLLDRMVCEGQGSGSYATIEEAKEKVARLINQDLNFIHQLQSEQRNVGEYYSPAYVWPIFDRVMVEVLNQRSVPQRAEKAEIVVLNDYEAVREYVKHQPEASSSTVYALQDVLENLRLFRLERKFRMSRVQRGVVEFSKRIEAGEFVSHLLARKAHGLGEPVPPAQVPSGKMNRVLNQSLYLAYRIKDRSLGKFKFYMPQFKALYRRARKILICMTFQVWYAFHLLRGKRVRWVQ